MSNTNLVLGCWKSQEWPECVTVSHEGMRELGRRYVPERTCKMEFQTGADNPRRGWWQCSECGGLCDSTVNGWNAAKKQMNPPSYCANCGAMVVAE